MFDNVNVAFYSPRHATPTEPSDRPGLGISRHNQTQADPVANISLGSATNAQVALSGRPPSPIRLYVWLESDET